MAEVSLEDHTIQLDLPVLVPEFTLSLTDVDVRGISVDGKALVQSSTRAGFRSGAFFTEGGKTMFAFDPTERQTTVQVH